MANKKTKRPKVLIGDYKGFAIKESRSYTKGQVSSSSIGVYLGNTLKRGKFKNVQEAMDAINNNKLTFK